MKYSEKSPLGQTWMGVGDLRDSLEWSPDTLIDGVDDTTIAGVEACIWTELISTPHDLYEMLLPRLAAVAEVAWAGSGEGQWDSFARRIAAQSLLWQEAGLNWHHSEEVPWPES
jgi:hexosaminidase